MNEIEILEFDTQLFGFKTVRFTGSVLDESKGKEVIKYCREEKVRCLFANFSADDFSSLSVATKQGFIITDIRVDFEKDISSFVYDKRVPEGYQIDNNVIGDDNIYLEKLAKQISKVSRFNFDKNFSEGSPDNLYAAWMENSIKGEQADELFIAREAKNKKPVGVITCKNKSDYGKIVLVGVDQQHRGKTIASCILNEVCRNFKNNNFKLIKVVASGKNIDVLRLYQKNGFFIKSVSIVLHLWLNQEEGT
ncbi:MAG: GNAT family N-acetyltransferase [bacterium]